MKKFKGESKWSGGRPALRRIPKSFLAFSLFAGGFAPALFVLAPPPAGAQQLDGFQSEEEFIDALERTPIDPAVTELLALEPKVRVAPLPEFDSFDIDSTTFTELAWIRRDLQEVRFETVITDLAAAAVVAQRSADLDERITERDIAIANLRAIENSLTSAAINGFLSDTGDQAAMTLAPNLDVLADESLANFTTTQLVIYREIAREQLADAEVAVDLAEDALAEAEELKALTAEAVLQATANIDTFEDRAESQARADARADAAAAAQSSEVALTSVAGHFIVNEAIAENLDRLVAHARADGIDFGGGGYRTIESQIALRLAHCGGSSAPSVGASVDEEGNPVDNSANQAAADAAWRNYVIYEAPSSSCSPPTAPPGSSEHQTGSAIDFTQEGSILTWSSPGFFWLEEHAADYGLFNLPSEAWHWSVDGS